jgi:hypothetical protein
MCHQDGSKKTFLRRASRHKQEDCIMNEVTTKDYTTLKNELKEHKRVCHLTKLEFQAILCAYATNDWQAVYTTRLYKNYSGEYCLLLELIARRTTATPA